MAGLRPLMLREVKQAAVYTLTAALSRVGALLLVPLFWNRLSPADYGQIALAELAAGLIGSVVGLQLETGLSRLYHEWPEDQRPRRLGAILVAGWGSAVAMTLVALPVFALLTPFIFDNVDFFPVIAAGVVGGALGRMRLLPVAAIRMKRLAWTYSALHLGGFVIYVVLALYLVVWRDLGLTGYLLAWLLSEAAQVLLAMLAMIRHTRFGLRGAGLREVLRYSLPLVPNAILGTASTLIDVFVLQKVATLPVLGIYAVSAKFVSLLPMLTDALKMSFAPLLYQAASEPDGEARAQVSRVRIFYLVPILAAGLVVAVVTEDFVRWVGNPEYFPVIAYVPLLVGPALLDATHAYYGSGLLLAKRTELAWIPTLFRLGLIVVTGVLLIPRWGLDGLVASRWATALPHLVLVVWMSQRHFPLPMQAGRLSLMAALLVACAALGVWLHPGGLLLDFAIDAGLVAAFCALATVVVVVSRNPQEGPQSLV